METINKKLLELYGRFEYLDIPNYRLVWSPDQFEKRWTKYTKEGFELITPEIKELPKYRQYANNRWILERCLAVPEFVETDLVEKYSYEPLWVFEDDKGEFQLPNWRAVQFIIESVIQESAKRLGRKYSAPKDGLVGKDLEEADRADIEKLKMQLFGNETDISDALAHKEGIVVP